MPLMAGKRGLIMGVANERSIAWGIAKALRAEGADLAFTYQGEALGKRVRPLAESLDSDFVVEADVALEASRNALFGNVSRRCVVNRDWPGLRLSSHCWMSGSASARRGGTPSTTTPIAGPWLSPQVVNRNRVPNELPAIGSAPVQTTEMSGASTAFMPTTW